MTVSAQACPVWVSLVTQNFFIQKTCNNPKIIQLTVSASIDLRRSIKKLGFYGEILLNKKLRNWQILLNKVLAWWFNQEWRFNGADTVFGITCPKVNIVLSAPRSWRKVCAIYNLHKSWYTGSPHFTRFLFFKINSVKWNSCKVKHSTFSTQIQLR